MKPIKFLFFCYFIIFLSIECEKVLIFTYSYNRPDFIEIQYKTFKKFLMDDYEFIVFNDAPDLSENEKLINNMCKKLDIKCIRIPQSIHSKPYLYRWPGENWDHPTIRCCNVVQYSMDTLGFDHNGIVVVLDSDMFLIRYFSIEEFMFNYDIVGVPQIHYDPNNPNISITHLSIDLMFLKMKNLPHKRTLNFNCGLIDNIPVDAAGQTYNYFKQYPDLNIKFITPLCLGETNKLNNKINNSDFEYLKNLGFNHKEINLIQQKPSNIEFHCYKNFLHYRAGSNWDNQSLQYHEKKTKMLNEFFKDIL